MTTTQYEARPYSDNGHDRIGIWKIGSDYHRPFVDWCSDHNVDNTIEELEAQDAADAAFAACETREERLSFIQAELDRIYDAISGAESFRRCLQFDFVDRLKARRDRYHRIISKMRDGWDIKELWAFSVVCPICGKEYRINQHAWQYRHANKTPDHREYFDAAGKEKLEELRALIDKIGNEEG